MDGRELLALAREALKNSYSPYSGVKVGAALLTAGGKVYLGCNIENAAFSPTICAERTAFAKAVSEGEREFSAIAVVGGKDDDYGECTPCGVCRQVMSEFCGGDFRIYTDDRGETKEYTLEQLLPQSFAL